MEKFDVYIDAVGRSTNAKVDVGVIFVKNDVTWYRFTRKVVDKWKLKKRAGYMKAIMIAVDFANKHDLFITVKLNHGNVLPSNIESLMKLSKISTKLFRTYNNELCLEYLETLRRCSANYELILIKSENPYQEYLRKITTNKLNRAI